MNETDLQASRLVAPVFVRYGENVVEPIEAMPGVYRYSVDQLGGYVNRLWEAGIRAVLLFGIPESKDEDGEPGLLQRRNSPEGDRRDQEGSSLDPGRCGRLPLRVHVSWALRRVLKDGEVDNDMTLPLLGEGRGRVRDGLERTSWPQAR